MNVLFLNHKKKQCGVYQYGLRLYNILKKTKEINYIYIEIETYEEYKICISYDYNFIIYNFHSCTMDWLNINSIQKLVKNIGIVHESNTNFFDIICEINPIGNSKYNIPRPIFENIDELLLNYKPSNIKIKEFIEYSEKDVPIFGSFGFGFENKGFEKIVKIVNDQYDKAIIKFVIPEGDFVIDTKQLNIQRFNELSKINIKEGIKLMIINDFLTNDDILHFLKKNTMNIFLYDYMYGRSISSTIDYAISVKVPIGISDSFMFRHIYSDEICLYKTSIENCLKNSVKYLEKFLNYYSHENIIYRFKEILNNNR